MTLSPGHHAGLQSLFYSYMMLKEKRADAVVVAAADEVYAQTYFNYDLIGYLYSGKDEDEYRLNLNEPKKKVLGEGAAALICETLTSAKDRGIPVLAEVRGLGMSIDGDLFDGQCLSTIGMERAIQEALQSANIDSSIVDLIIWAPQGNAQDMKVLDSCKKIFSDRMNTIPVLTTTFNTGYIESASLLLSTAALLRSIKSGKEVWPQKYRVDEIDKIKIITTRFVLVAGSSDVGYNFAALLDTKPEVD
jgi:3-oxoacyl-(acyl-carrier-protein) synthase